MLHNYCYWDNWIYDITYADDGFGNLIMTELDTFWYVMNNWIVSYPLI